VSNERLLMADDHPVLREGLALALRHGLPNLSVDQVGSVAEAEALIDGGRRYRLVLLDLMLPDSRGFSGLMSLQYRLVSTPITIISARREPMLIDAARALGAAGYINKSEPLDIILKALRQILAGQRVFAEVETSSDAACDIRARIKNLSPAQHRVLLALSDGRLNKQIAADLGVTEATVKAHLSAIFRTLGVTNRIQALLAMQPLLGDAGKEPLG
jgi:DNA-binding NarL/FixJ family response regulator